MHGDTWADRYEHMPERIENATSFKPEIIQARMGAITLENPR